MLGELGEGEELRIVGGSEFRRGECEQNGAEESYALDFAGVRVCAREDGLEDAGEVERIERRCEGACDDCASFREVVACRVELPVRK